ncbi:protein kinase [Bradyrhizobium sp. LA6.12]|uniref:protein kinase domain-containing protein n=1 Tax=unclassified Bradyrhizobium TaxID=2631580 RepID=UPI003395A0D9
MPDEKLSDVAARWCAARGEAWTVSGEAGDGGTSEVFAVQSPDGDRALKLYNRKFSSGSLGTIEKKRIEAQLELGINDCPYLVDVFEGGEFEGHLYLLMNRAPGRELAKRLTDIPREKIRSIVDQIAQALIFLRSRGLCHRDVKSANVFISDDFNHATLLDLSVTRNVNDPVGLGTDQDNQLPVVATARYSPPEYLFRLLQPAPEAWHALDIYQLGGLLHDLIMRKQLFETEFQKSRDNRYRFAWIVATVAPTVNATDVDRDLIFLVRRALDKDWEKRALMKLEDFLADNERQQALALNVLGFAGSHRVAPSTPSLNELRRRVGKVAEALELRMHEFLKRQGLTATHHNEAGRTDCSKILRFAWDAEKDTPLTGKIQLTTDLHLKITPQGQSFECKASLHSSINGLDVSSDIQFPDVPDDAGSSDQLGEQIEASLGSLATSLLRVS